MTSHHFLKYCSYQFPLSGYCFIKEAQIKNLQEGLLLSRDAEKQLKE